MHGKFGAELGKLACGKLVPNVIICSGLLQVLESP